MMNRFNSVMNSVFPEKKAVTDDCCMCCLERFCNHCICPYAPAVISCPCKPLLCNGCVMRYALTTGTPCPVKEGFTEFRCPSCRGGVCIPTESLILGYPFYSATQQ